MISGFQKETRSIGSKIVELVKSVASLEVKMRNGKEKETKLKQLKLEFLLLILKHGIDSREDGCVWIMREIKKSSGVVREDMLPDFIDSDSREFIRTKFISYKEMMNLREKNAFYLKFYKLMVGEFSAMDQVVKDVKAKLKKSTDDPYWEMITETDSVKIISPYPTSAKIEAENTSLMMRDGISQGQFSMHDGRVQSAFAPSIAGDYNPDELINPEQVTVRGAEVVVKHGNYPRDNQVEFSSNNNRDFKYQLNNPDLIEGGSLNINAQYQTSTLNQFERNEERNNTSMLPNIGDLPPSSTHLANIELRYSAKTTKGVGTAAAMASRSQISSSARMFPPVSGRSLVSAAFSSLATRKQEEFSKLGIVYIGDANYRFGKNNKRLLVGDDGQCEAILLSNELVSQAVKAYRKKELVSMRGSSGNHSKSSLPRLILDKDSVVGLGVDKSTDVYDYKGSITAEDSNGLSRLASGNTKLHKAGSFSFDEEDNLDNDRKRKLAEQENLNQQVLVGEEEDPFTTHVLFFDEDVLINSFKCKMDLVKEHINMEAKINIIEADLFKAQKKEAGRVLKIYKEKAIQEEQYAISKSKSLRQQQLSRRTKEETVLIPHFQEKPVGAYMIDPLVYLCTMMGSVNLSKVGSRLKY